MKRICGVCQKPITRLFGDAEELQHDLGVDLSAYIKPSSHDERTEYVCQRCCHNRTDDVIQFLTREQAEQ